MSLWTDTIVAEAVGGKIHGRHWEADRVEIDSRRVKVGDLFFALKGERFDGHEFAAAAIARMAAAAVVSKPLPEKEEERYVVVGDTLKALQALGSYARNRSQGKIVGITGSVGKTSTKEMTRLALSAHGEVFASHGNYNNHIGVPLNLSNLPPQCPFGVFEMGMNHKGEIAELTRMVRPHVAVVTGVEAVHLEFFKSVSDIAEAKAEIFDGVAEGGVAVLNCDNPHFELLKKIAQQKNVNRIISCGEGAKADCRVLDYRATMDGVTIRADIYGKKITYTIGAIGRHWANVSVQALAVAYALRLDVEQSAAALAAFSEPEGRGGAERFGDIVLIDDSYNASPTSMRAAFAKTAEVWEAAGGKGRKIAVLGDMLELGEDSARLHAELAIGLQRHSFSIVLTCGKWMESLHQVLPPTIRSGHAVNPQTLLPSLIHTLQQGDVVLVKGSHGSKMYELANMLKNELGRLAKEKTYAL